MEKAWAMRYESFSLPVVEMFPNMLDGIVEKEINLNHDGRVKCQGISWRARLHSPGKIESLSPGEVINIIGRENNVLLVSPEI
ncbi:MAG: NfeD family protein [Cyanobacteria bacterium J06639_14]